MYFSLFLGFPPCTTIHALVSMRAAAGSLSFLGDHRELPITEPLSIPNVEQWKKQYGGKNANYKVGEEFASERASQPAG